jgi:hypothetical protein
VIDRADRGQRRRLARPIHDAAGGGADHAVAGDRAGEAAADHVLEA